MTSRSIYEQKAYDDLAAGSHGGMPAAGKIIDACHRMFHEQRDLFIPDYTADRFTAMWLASALSHIFQDHGMVEVNREVLAGALLRSRLLVDE